MPPQKNSGNKGAKRETGVSTKNRKFIQSFLEDSGGQDSIEDVYVARIIKKMGNGRVQVFFVDNNGKPQTVQGIIRGTFRGKAKRSVWIEDNSIVLLADSEIAGPAQFEVMAVLSADQVHDLKKVKENIDPRVLAVDITDTTQLMSKNPIDIGGGFEFDAPDTEEVDIDDI